MKKHVMSEELKQIRNDFLSHMLELQRQSKDHNDPQREYIARVLAMLAGAIQEGQAEGLANYVYEWGRKNLQNWKKEDALPK